MDDRDPEQRDLTRVFDALRRGEEGAEQQLFALVYDELHRMAHGQSVRFYLSKWIGCVGTRQARFDIGAYEREDTTLVPADVANLHWVDAETLAWDATPAASEYHVYRDLASALAYDAVMTCRDDLDANRNDLELIDAEVPPVGVCWIYLISAETAGGDEGTIGLATCTERSNFSPCP